MDHLKFIKEQHNSFTELVSNDLEKVKEKVKNIISTSSALGARNPRDVDERLRRIEQLENERIQLLLTEEKLKKAVQQQIEAKETISKKSSAFKEEKKVTRSSLAAHDNIFRKYISKLKLVLKLEKVEGHIHTLQIHFVNYEKYPVKLVIDVESRTIVSVCLDNLTEDSKKELLQILENQKECTSFLIKLRECVTKQAT